MALSLWLPIDEVGGNGVRGVPGVEKYRPLHFGHLNGSSGDAVTRGPLSFPGRRG